MGKYKAEIKNAQNKVIESETFNTIQAARMYLQTAKMGGRGKGIRGFINGKIAN